VERRGVRARIELRISEQCVELRYLVDRCDEVAEVLAHVCQTLGVLGGVEEGARVYAVRDGHYLLEASSALKSSDSIASSIRRRWSLESSTLPVTFVAARSVNSATSCRIWPSARCVSASICRFVSSSRR